MLSAPAGTAMRVRIACAGALALAAAPVVDAQDLEGATDPHGLVRYPDSWIVAYAPPRPARSYEFITGRVDRSQRDRRVDSSRRVAGELQRATYRMPGGTRYQDVIGHYQSLALDFGGEVVFTCRGRACGRSTVWANDVFGVKELVAPDSEQFYLAAAAATRLLAIYVVQRGNRRVYAHLDVVETELGAEQTPDVASSLSRQDYAVLRVAPANDGALDSTALAALAVLARQLGAVADRPLHIVCHLPGDAEDALPRSRQCAERAAAAFGEGGLEAVPFGAGPLLPRPDAAPARLELVAPQALP